MLCSTRRIALTWFLGAMPLGCAAAAPSAPTTAPEPPPSPKRSSPSERAAAEPHQRPVAARPLVVGTWNIRRLGHGTKDLETVAAVLRGFDVVATQEVMTPAAVEALRERMPEHAALLTDVPRPRDAKYREYFAFFYRTDRVRPTFSSDVPDPDDRFVRDPFVACFEVEGLKDELCLMTVHIVWGKRVAERKQEILALDDAMRWAQTADTSSAWVVLGDFNRVVDDGDADDYPEDEWAELLDPGALEVPVQHLGVELPTTIGAKGYANAYDHIFVSASLAERVLHTGRYDFVREHCAGAFETCKTTISDHAPVLLRLRADTAPAP